jgi:hypothetical protein
MALSLNDLRTVAQAASETGKTQTAVRYLASVHKLGIKVGGARLFAPEDIEKIKGYAKTGRKPDPVAKYHDWRKIHPARAKKTN